MAVAGLSDVGLDFRLLGPLEVWADGRPLRLAGRSRRALLSLLLLHANEVVSSDRLIEEIVGSRSGGTAANALQAAVSRLRRALGDGGGHIVTRSPGYLLQSAPEMIDRVRFERLYAQGREALRGGDPRRAALSLREALALWRGEPLADLAGYQFAAGERLRLNELRFAVVLERIDADLGLGRHAGLVAELEPLVLDHPLDQRLRAQHMLALYRSGRDADALRAYQEARTELVHELGVEPGTELRELQRAILEQAPSLDLLARPVAAGSARADFVGRERELAELSAGLNDAFAGHGRVYLLAGEPGIGKSRLAEEVVDRARAAGSRVLIGRCWEAGGAPAFWPWVQALRAYVRGTDAAILRTQLGAGAGDIANLLPELRGLFPDLGVPTTLQSDSARFRLFSAVSAFLVAAAETAPLTLVLDDLHASDEPSLLLLEFLTRSVGDARILVVAAYRDVDPTVREPLSAALAELAREPVTRRLVLSGLQQREVARIIERIAGEVPGEGLVEAIYLETEGNPFFAGEIVRLLAPQGHLDGRNPTRHAIPQTVRDVVSRRLRHLSSECNRLLVLASVLGREFPLDLLAHLGDVAPDDLGTLDEAVYERVLVDVPDDPDQLRFAHVIIRDALYDRLTSARRVRLHRLAVEALEALGKDDPGSRLAGLAHHSIAGRDFSRGCVYARRAGDRASALLAFEEAARLYEVALGAGETAGLTDEERCELLVTLGDVQARAGDMPAARVSFVRAAELATAHGSTELLARAALGYGGRFLFTRDTEDRRIVTLLEAAAHALGEEESRLSVRVLTRLGNAVSQHAPGSASVLTGRAVEIARRLNDPTTIGYAISGRLWATRAPVDLDERLILTRELTALTTRSSHSRDTSCSTWCWPPAGTWRTCTRNWRPRSGWRTSSASRPSGGGWPRTVRSSRSWKGVWPTPRS
jgi:DNA-binding SARP family transcriptional activator